MRRSLKSQKNFTKTGYFGGARSFKVIDVGTPGNLVSSACYDTQQVCVYLQPFSSRDGLEKSRHKSATSRFASFGICERARHDMTNGLWHIAGLSRRETVKSSTSSCLVAGMSRACHGEVGIMEFGLFQTET